MKATAGNNLPQPLEIQFKLIHYEAADAVTWHVKFDVAELSDTAFATPKFSKNTSSDVTNWYFRDDTPNSAGQGLTAFPSGGVSTNRSNNEAPRLMGTCVYLLAVADRQTLVSGRRYLLRAAQYNGEAWGAWFEAIIGVE